MKRTFLRFFMTAGIIALFILVIVWRANALKPSVSVVFVGRGEEEWMASDAAFDAVAKAWHSLPGHKEDKIEYIKTGIRLDTTIERDAILAQLIYGEGVIYLADKEVIRDILPEDGLFLPLPEGVPATVFDSAGCGIGVRLNMLSVLADYPLPDSFCYFVRAPKTEDKALLHYFEKNQSPAMETLLRLFH